MSQEAARQFSDGHAYERLMGRWSRKVGVQFLDWCNVPADRAWLDVGCGNGAFTEEILAKANPSHVTGIDPAPAQIEFARKRLDGTRAAFQLGDAQSLPFADGVFDVACMALVIVFVPDPAKGVAEMKRVTRRGGMIATYMWDLPNGGVPTSPFYAALRDMGFPAPMPPQAEASRQEALIGLWRAAGVGDIETTVLRITVEHPNFEAFWEANILPVGPQADRIRQLDASAREALKQRLKARFRTMADGSIKFESFANAVKGVV
jgi:ubiquinone/menaquinone biosynthesis C-methylase UbiE